jgi:hypothetical protein
VKLTPAMQKRLEEILARIEFGEVTIKVNALAKDVTFSVKTDERISKENC